jgi:hypothetical protein
MVSAIAAWHDLDNTAGVAEQTIMAETLPSSERPTPEQIAIWRRRLAGQANNRAWDLAESSSRTDNDNEEMLSAAHAAAFFWNIVGNAKNRAHAELLLAHVNALLGLRDRAMRHLSKARPYFDTQVLEPSELAISLLIEANVAAACGDAESHKIHYAAAVNAIEALPDPENRKLMGATLKIIPIPGNR